MMAADVAVSLGGAVLSTFELNVAKPLIAHNNLQVLFSLAPWPYPGPNLAPTGRERGLTHRRSKSWEKVTSPKKL